MYTGSFGPISNRADWHEKISLVATGETDIPAVTEAVLSFGNGCPPPVTKKLSAAELAYDDPTGVLTFTVSDADLRCFRPGSYPMGILLTIDGTEEQLFSGTLEVIDGVVP